MSIRQGNVQRKTTETQISLELVLEGSALYQGSSGIGFLDHMLQLFAKHSGFDLTLEASGDLDVDFHHSVEDIGLCLGQAFLLALGEKKGIARYASLALPMDEALVMCAVDISGRPGYYGDISFPSPCIGKFDSELVEEFWKAFVNEARITLHIKQLAGKNSHHLAEALFKGMGRLLKMAVKVEGADLPSTKGVL